MSDTNKILEAEKNVLAAARAWRVTERNLIADASQANKSAHHFAKRGLRTAEDFLAKLYGGEL